MIKFEHVGLRYGIGPEVLSDISFTLEQGSFHFLCGPSGAGKSSLMTLLYLGRKCSRGQIHMMGKDTGKLKRDELAELRQKIGVVFQDFRLLPHLSAFDNAALPLRISGVSEKKIKNHVEELLDWVGLGDCMRRLPATLSGGQQQRIAVARAVIANPRLLLADEPTGNLDDETSMKLMGLFEQLNKMGTTILIATHSTQILDRLPHCRLILNQGNLEIFDPTAAIAPSLASGEVLHA